MLSMTAWETDIPPCGVHAIYSGHKKDANLIVNITDLFSYYSSLFSIYFIILFAIEIFPALHSKQQIVPLNGN